VSSRLEADRLTATDSPCPTIYGTAATKAQHLDSERADKTGLLGGGYEFGGAQDPRDLRGGALGILPLQRDRKLKHGGVDAAPGLAGRRRERLEPADAVTADPAVQRVAGVAAPPAERASMGAGGDRPHHPAAGLGRQARIQGRADQLVGEQRHLLCPGTPGRVVVLVGVQLRRARVPMPCCGRPQLARTLTWRAGRRS
jgi:hypothetical protein